MTQTSTNFNIFHTLDFLCKIWRNVTSSVINTSRNKKVNHSITNFLLQPNRLWLTTKLFVPRLNSKTRPNFNKLCAYSQNQFSILYSHNTVIVLLTILPYLLLLIIFILAYYISYCIQSYILFYLFQTQNWTTLLGQKSSNKSFQRFFSSLVGLDNYP